MSSREPENTEALRQEVRAWLRANLPKGWGTPAYVAPERLSREAHDFGKQWQKNFMMPDMRDSAFLRNMVASSAHQRRSALSVRRLDVPEHPNSRGDH